MTISDLDRTSEVEGSCSQVPVNPYDHCVYYEKHPYTFLWTKDCWTCKYSYFDLDTGSETETGICIYQQRSAK